MREIIEERKLPALGPRRAVCRKAGQLFIKGRVGKVHVFLIHFLLSQLDSLAETLEMDNLAFPEEANDIIYVRIVRQAENVVIGEARFLLWCDLVRTTFFVGGIGFL